MLRVSSYPLVRTTWSQCSLATKVNINSLDKLLLSNTISPLPLMFLMERLSLDTITVRSRPSMSMEATKNSLMHPTSTERPGVYKCLKIEVHSWLAVMTTSSTNSVSKINVWSEKVKSGPMTCTRENLTRQTRSNQLHLHSVQHQFTNRVEVSLTVKDGTMSLSATIMVMWPS